jgi:integrase
MIEGVHFVRRQRPGRSVIWYVYAWRGGPCIMRVECPSKPKLTPEALAELVQAREHLQGSKETLGALARDWRYRSPEWAALAQSTQRTWASQLIAIEDKWDSTPLSLWNDPRMVRKVRDWRDSRASTPRAADIGITVLRALLEFGRQRAVVSINVADRIGTLYRGGSRAEIVWTDEDVERFTATAVALEQPHIIDGLRLAALTGLRRADLVTLTWDNVGEFALVKKALKASRRKRRFATMPRIPELDALLEELKLRNRQEGVNTLLVNSWGRSWSADGFGGSFNRIRDAAGVVHTDPETGATKAKHLHDLRGTFATKLIMHGANLTDQEVADIMGWSPQQVADIRRVYVDQARVIVAIGQRIRGAL